MHYRTYDPERDREAAFRIFLEVGWVKDDEEHRKVFDLIETAGRTLVAEVGGEAECLVSNEDAVMRYQDEELVTCIVGAVVVSRVARQRGLASRLTARAIAEDVRERGAAVATLGIFDQGFYDRHGFGTGRTVHRWRLDPAHLVADARPRTPIRLTCDDSDRMHANRLTRRKHHGLISALDPGITRAATLAPPGGFGLGYEDPESGELTHHVWVHPDKVGGGPYIACWMAYRTRDQFRELMALLGGLGDQVKLVVVKEPAGMQIQDLLRTPFRRMDISAKGDFEQRQLALAYQQFRICDLPACLSRTHLPGSGSVSFNLELTDPIERFLDEATRELWPGVGGAYRVTLGPDSHAERTGPDDALPTMRTSVNTFTRLWLGVRPATGLAFTASDLDAPRELLEQLDAVVRVPAPHTDWDY